MTEIKLPTEEAISVLFTMGWQCVWEYPGCIKASHPVTGKAHRWPLKNGICTLRNHSV